MRYGPVRGRRGTWKVGCARLEILDEKVGQEKLGLNSEYVLQLVNEWCIEYPPPQRRW